MMNQGDLEKELQGIPPWMLDKFIQSRIVELCEMVRPGNQVNAFQEGYFCSRYDSKLDDEQAWWHYCAVCMAPFNCCDEGEEPCFVCGERAEELVRETYKGLHASLI